MRSENRTVRRRTDPAAVATMLLDADTPDRLASLGTAAVQRVAGGDVARVCELDVPSGALTVIHQDTSGPDPSEPLVRRATQHPIIEHYRATRFVRPVRISDVVEPRVWRNNPLYREAYRPHRLYAQVSFPYWVGGPRMRSLTINRASQFSTSDLRRLDEFRICATRVAALVHELADRQELMRVLDGALVEDGILLLLDPDDRRVRHVSGSRAELLDDPALLAALTAPGPTPRRVSTAGRHGVTLVVHLGRVRHWTAIRAVVQPSDIALTAREQQVLERLAAGRTAAAIGRELRVAERTVHRHLDNLYRKLGVHDRLDAVLRATGLGLLPPRCPAQPACV